MRKVTVTVQLTTPDDFADDDASTLVTQALEMSQTTLDSYSVAVDGVWTEDVPTRDPRLVANED